MFQGESLQREVEELMERLEQDERGIGEVINVQR
jgi:hypothetical protein